MESLGKRRSIQQSNLLLIVLISISFLLITPSSILADPTIPPYFYISTEVGGGNNATLRGLVDDQDDIWRADALSAGATGFVMVDFGTQTSDGLADIQPNNPGPYPPGNPVTNPLTLPDGTYFSFPTSDGLSLTVSLIDMDGGDLFGGTMASMTATWPRLARSATLQDSAPRPASLYSSTTADRPRMWNEAIGSGSSRNAVLFQFSQPVAAFGAWFGDVETRTDGAGTAARVQLFDASDNLIDDRIIPTSTTDQSLCGSPVNDSYVGCGNETTRWIGFIDPNVRVSAMLVIVGDDDSDGDTLGYGESISFIGATVAEGITAPVPEPERQEPELPATGFAPGVRSDLDLRSYTKYSQETMIEIHIPTLGLETDVVGVPQKSGQWNVEWLGNKVGYLEGTSYPTWAGNTVLTGHVYDHTGSPGVFANLHSLRYGDTVIIHAWGQRYVYEVREITVVDPDDLSVVDPINDGYDWLTLLTCLGYNEDSNSYHYRLVVRSVLTRVY